MAFSGDGDIVLEANSRLQEIVSASPENEDGVNLLAVTEWRLGKLEDAEQRLRALLERSPAHFEGGAHAGVHESVREEARRGGGDSG